MSKKTVVAVSIPEVEETVIHPLDLAELRRLGFTEEDIQTMNGFLSKFCSTGRIYAIRVIVRAKLKGLSFKGTLDVLLDLWNEVWKHGTPGRLADPDDVSRHEANPESVKEEGTTQGLLNTCAFFECYKRLVMKLPKGLY